MNLHSHEGRFKISLDMYSSTYTVRKIEGYKKALAEGHGFYGEAVFPGGISVLTFDTDQLLGLESIECLKKQIDKEVLALKCKADDQLAELAKVWD